MYALIGLLSRYPARLRRVRRVALALPQRLMFFLVAALGAGCALWARDFRATVERNLAALLPETSPRQRHAMSRRYLVHECLTVYEQLIEYPRTLVRQRGIEFVVEGREHLDAALAHGRGAIVYTPHVGNYMYAYWKLSQHYTCQSVVTAGSPELRPFFLQLQDIGLAGLDYDNEPPQKLAMTLRRHLHGNGVLYLLGDFSRPSFDSCQLFGRPSPLPAGAVTLALSTGAPIVPLVTWREGWFRHRVCMSRPIHLGERFSLRQRPQALQELAHVLEGLILRKPEQWFYWFNIHERWTAPPSSAAAASASSPGSPPPVAGATGAADRR